MVGRTMRRIRRTMRRIRRTMRIRRTGRKMMKKMPMKATRTRDSKGMGGAQIQTSKIL